MKWDILATKETIDKTVESLKKNGMEVSFVGDSKEAKERVLELLPTGAEVLTMTSVTLDTLGISNEINESGKYNSVRRLLMRMDRATQFSAMQKIGAAPEWTLGSFHALTEDGQIMIASRTGSQLPAYAYGSSHVILVAGVQKIVKNIAEGARRIYEHCLPLESERAHKAYGVEGSRVNKILTINADETPGRIHLILVNEVLGF